MFFDFMTPDVWDGLVLGTIFIGLSLAVLRLISDRAVYKQEQKIRRWKAEHRPGEPEPHTETDHDQL